MHKVKTEKLEHHFHKCIGDALSLTVEFNGVVAQHNEHLSIICAVTRPKKLKKVIKSAMFVM